MGKNPLELGRYLKSRGIEYLIGVNLSGCVFLIFCGFLGVLGMLIAAVMGHSIPIAILGFFVGCGIPFFMLEISNQSDNDGMLIDIKNIFQMLKIQVHAGVYIVDALENCCGELKSKRLKKEINRLITEIYMSKDINLALDDFNGRFENGHIDTLVVILKQSIESGYSVNNLDSAFEQVVDVERAINVKVENSVERNVQVIQVMFMAGIIAIAMYCSVVEFKSLFEIF